MSDIYEKFGVPTIINGVGYATRVAGRWHDRLESPLELIDCSVADENARVRLEADAIVMTRKRLTYRGRVQGVGFRYTCLSISRKYPLQGYVQNLPDGRVVMEVQGASADVTSFLDDVQLRMDENIRETIAAVPRKIP